MGQQHLNEMKKAGMTPVSVADLDEERLQVAEEDFPGIETYTSSAEMLAESDVNLVVIITPHNTHAELALQCLNAGRHVVCEKPLAITTEECDQMIEAARSNDVILSTYHNRHWDGCILRAVEQIRDQGVIGEVLRIEAHMGGYGQPGDWWRSSKSISGGILYDWGVHLLEYSLQILDGNMREVNGYAVSGHWGSKTKWKEDTNEDEATAIVRFDNGQLLSLRMTSIDSNPKEGQLEITGTDGTYIFEGGSWKTITHENGTQVIRKGNNPQSEGWRFYQNIADHLTGDEPLIITAEWARRPIHILDLANKSAKSGEAMKTTYE
ncbi:MAG: Gfo/Idh/MocA family oxidoreductase [Planctomycetes bacterium]|nr:Gfo/Idh/MocA family oxidoreductase [Planctomycetota bacterium]